MVPKLLRHRNQLGILDAFNLSFLGPCTALKREPWPKSIIATKHWVILYPTKKGSSFMFLRAILMEERPRVGKMSTC